jgi:RNA polymerase sigma-70 factor (ECF subfamily)
MLPQTISQGAFREQANGAVMARDVTATVLDRVASGTAGAPVVGAQRRARGVSPSMADAPLPEDDLVAAIPRLRRYARVLTGDPTRADDLVQETLARAWEKRRLWAAGSDLRAWMFTIMHNLFVNQRAQAARDARNVSIDDDGDGTGALQLPVAASQHVRVELIEVLRELARLPAEQREVLVLAGVEEMRYEEIAQVLAIPVGTVMSRLSRAREKLRRSMAETAGAPRATSNGTLQRLR